jgi:dethiobiotin synthetase
VKARRERGRGKPRSGPTGAGLFITGTDTGVGKTVVAGTLADLLRARGVDIGVMKPVETGCPRREGRLEPQDALHLKARAEAADPVEDICPYALELPAAPAVAAQAAGITIDLDRIAVRFRTIVARHRLTLVEGAGGLLVPLTETADYTHLIQKLNIPVLLVARTSLGTINHTLLTCYWARHVGLPLLGVVLNCAAGPPSPSEEANLEALTRRLPVPVLGRVPFLPDGAGEVARAEGLFDLTRLLRLLGLA